MSDPTVEHDLVPIEATDGDTFKCSRCGASFTFVDLNDGQPGEWVDVTPAGPAS